LIKTATADGVERLKFVSRDGYLLDQAFKLIALRMKNLDLDMRIPTGEYFLCSRRTAIFANFETENDIFPVLERDFKGTAQNNFTIIGSIHKGALCFIKDLIDAFGKASLDIEFPREIVLDIYEEFIGGELDAGQLTSFLTVEDEYCGNQEVAVFGSYRSIKTDSRLKLHQ
jgi:hypothetical protein